MIIKKFSLCYIFLFHCLLVSSQNLLTHEDTKNLSSLISQEISTLNFDEAFNHLKSNWPIPEKDFIDIKNQTPAQIELFTKMFGSIVGLEFIDEDHVANCLSRYIYLLKFEKHAIRLIYVYYKGKEKWIVFQFKWDDKILEFFE